LVVEKETLKQHMPRIRSRLLGLLSSQSADGLSTDADKKRMDDELEEAMKKAPDAETFEGIE